MIVSVMIITTIILLFLLSLSLLFTISLSLSSYPLSCMSVPTDYLIQSIKSAQQAIQINNNSNKKRSKLPKKHIEFPCSICNLEVKHNDKAILCTCCELWSHIRCNNISVSEYRELQEKNRDFPEAVDSDTWQCMKCVLNERSEFTPFIYSSVNDLINLNSLDSLELLDSLPNPETQAFATQNNKLLINDIDEDTVENIDCRYYSCKEFFTMSNENSFNIFHSNVN